MSHKKIAVFIKRELHDIVKDLDKIKERGWKTDYRQLEEKLYLILRETKELGTRAHVVELGSRGIND